MVYHEADTRFPGKGEFHQVRVHEFFLNEEGWPVVSPLLFVPRQVPTDDVPGHDVPEDSAEGDAISDADIPVSTAVQFHEDGTVDGALEGVWTYAYPGTITLTDALGVESKGVISVQWNEWTECFTVVFSVMSADGLTLWGIQTTEDSVGDQKDVDPE